MIRVVTEYHQYRPHIASKLNRNIYCHHCKKMEHTTLLGFNEWKTTVFKCQRCDGLILVDTVINT